METIGIYLARLAIEYLAVPPPFPSVHAEGCRKDNLPVHGDIISRPEEPSTLIMM